MDLCSGVLGILPPSAELVMLEILYDISDPTR
jgi:hypothetical protein